MRTKKRTSTPPKAESMRQQPAQLGVILREGIVTALAHGHPIYPVATVEEAAIVAARLHDPLLAGEQAGILEDLLTRLAIYKEKTIAIKAKIKSALMYPVSILAIAFVVTAVIICFAPSSVTLTALSRTMKSPTCACWPGLRFTSSSLLKPLPANPREMRTTPT